MASLRETYRVAWDNREPVEVTTTVQDLIDAVEALAVRGYSNNRVALETTLIHCALERTKADVPPYSEWINVLDSYEQTAPGGGTTVAGPTPAKRSRTGRSSSRASPGSRGGPGSDGTPGP